MVKRSPTLGALVSAKTKCMKLIFIGKITRVPVAFLMALSIFVYEMRIHLSKAFFILGSIFSVIKCVPKLKTVFCISHRL